MATTYLGIQFAQWKALIYWWSPGTDASWAEIEGPSGCSSIPEGSRDDYGRLSSIDAGGKAAGGVISYQNLTVASSPGVGLNNNIISSYIQAGKIITLDGATNINMLIVPGIREKLVTRLLSLQR